MSLAGSKGGVVSEMNVVPLIDILLVLLVIFMIIPSHQKGLDAVAPQLSVDGPQTPQPEVVVVQVIKDGSLKINEQPVAWSGLRDRLLEVFAERATKVAFIRGDDVVEFAVVAQVIDAMHTAGISSVGLLTPKLAKGL